MAWVKLVVDRAEIRDADQARRSVRFYADEDVDAAIISLVRSWRYEVESLGERGLVRHSQEFHFERSAATACVLLTQDHAYLDESRFPLSQTCGVWIVDVARTNVDHFAHALDVVDLIVGDGPSRWQEKKLVIGADYALSMYQRAGEGDFQHINVSHYKFDAIGTGVWVWEDA